MTRVSGSSVASANALRALQATAMPRAGRGLYTRLQLIPTMASASWAPYGALGCCAASATPLRQRASSASRARPEEQPVDVTALRARVRALAGDVEILDIQAQDLVGARGSLIQAAARGCVRAGRCRGAARAAASSQRGCCGCGRAARRGAAARRRRRRAMPALRDHGGQASAGHGRVAELVLGDGERLAVLHAGCGREVGLREKRVDRHGQVAPGRSGHTERGSTAGGGHKRCSTAGRPRSPARCRATSQETCRLRARRRWRTSAPGRAAPGDPRGSAGRVRGEWALSRGRRGATAT